MKRIISCLLVCVIIFSLYACKKSNPNPVENYNNTPEISLNQIADKINSCKTVTEQKNLGQNTVAVAQQDGITITTSAEGLDPIELIFTLKGNVLSADIDLIHSFQALILVDCIGQIHGYSDGETLSTLNSEKFENYSLDKEGIEITDIDDELSTIKIDITKKFPLVDVSEDFIEVSDLENKKRFISGGGSGQGSKGDIAYLYQDSQKEGYDHEVTTLVIGEKRKLTENSYKSLLSVLEVMFGGKEVVNYFKANYSDFSLGNKSFSGFQIEINPVRDEWESFVLNEEYVSVVRVTIDKEMIKSELK